MAKENDAGRISQPKSIVDCLMEIPLFDDLRDMELNTAAKHMNFFELEKDEVLFKEDDPGDYVCFIVAGELQVLKKTRKTGQKVLIATLTKNRSIGEMSVIDNTKRSATVKASTRSTIIALSKRGFDQILEENPIIGIKILKQLSRLMSMNLRKTSSQLTGLFLPLT